MKKEEGGSNESPHWDESTDWDGSMDRDVRMNREERMNRDPGRVEWGSDGVTGAALSSGDESPGSVLDEAHRLLRLAADRLDRTAAVEGWPVPFSPVRYLVLHHLSRATAFGLTPVRIGRILSRKPSSLAHHIDVLEEAGLVGRRGSLRPPERRRATDGGRRVRRAAP